MKMDSHNHIGHRKGESYPIEVMIREMAKAGIDRAIATGHPEAIDNDYVSYAQKKFKDRIYGFGIVNPWDYEAEKELERCFRELDLYGLKLNPLRHGYALDRREIVDPLFEICQKYNKPVLCHGLSDMFNMPGKFEVMARAYPKVPIILAHIGEPDAVDWAIRVAQRNENIYVDTAGIILTTLKRAIEGIDPSKILMGTDAPWGKFELSLQLVESATDSQEIIRMISGENAYNLLFNR
jgi:predicted TIM-barrel fold metal-dependent hydrolase